MKGDSFNTEMMKLCIFFDKPLNEPQLDIWYDCLKHLPDRVFKDAVEFIVRNHRFFPTPEDFLGFFREHEPKYKPLKHDDRTVEEIKADLAKRNKVLTEWRENKDINNIIGDKQ
jgi:hypothetical protein